MKRLIPTCLALLPIPVATSPVIPQADAGDPVQDETAAESLPEVERGLKVNAEGAFRGYTLFAPLTSKTIYLMDLEGEIVHRWECGEWSGSPYLLDDGHLLFCAQEADAPGTFQGGGIGGRLVKIDWEANVVWTHAVADEYQVQHHDIEPMPNGNLLLIIWEHRYPEDVIEFGRDPEHVGEQGLWPDAILELEPVGADEAKIVWEWHAWDHLIQDFDPERRNYGSVPAHPELIDINADHRDRPALTEEERVKQAAVEAQMRALGYAGGDEDEEDDGDAADDGGSDKGADWLHSNGIDYHPEYDLIVISTPQLSEFWVIDHSTSTRQAASHRGGRWGKGGDLLFRWGNPRNYGAGQDSDRKLFYQHDPEWILDGPAGELRLTIFNNGRGRAGGDFSSVDEFVLPFDPEQGFVREPGKPFGPAEPVWSYSDQGNFFSSFISGAHRLPNGNTFICSGAPGRMLEVTPEGEIVWDFLNPYAGDTQPGEKAPSVPRTALFRATRIAPDHPGLKALEL